MYINRLPKCSTDRTDRTLTVVLSIIFSNVSISVVVYGSWKLFASSEFFDRFRVVVKFFKFTNKFEL